MKIRALILTIAFLASGSTVLADVKTCRLQNPETKNDSQGFCFSEYGLIHLDEEQKTFDFSYNPVHCGGWPPYEFMDGTFEIENQWTQEGPRFRYRMSGQNNYFATLQQNLQHADKFILRDSRSKNLEFDCSP